MHKTIIALLLILMAAAPLAAQNTTAVEMNRANWGELSGFKPELKQPGYEPGVTIDGANIDSFKEIVPDGARILMEKYGMKIDTKEYEPYAPSDGYIAATNKNRGKTSLVTIGDSIREREILGYEGGLPFPSPKNGREIAWNYVLSYGGDDNESSFEVFWIHAGRGVERSETWKTTSIRRAKFRTDIEPIPEVPLLVEKGVIAATLTQALAPQDKKGYASLYYGYLEPKEPEGWLYIPAQRRTIRLAFGLKGETWNSTDLLYEDVGGFTGSPEWMNWNLVKKTTMLLPLNAGVNLGKGNAKELYDFENKPHWNPTLKWELRPVYIVESTPKVNGYPYSKMILTIDAESSKILAKTAYDRKGNLWKVLIGAGNGSENPAREPGKVAMFLVVDVQADHATAFYFHEQKSNIGAPPTLFSQTTLRKLGK